MYSIHWVAEVHRWLCVCKVVSWAPFLAVATQTPGPLGCGGQLNLGICMQVFGGRWTIWEELSNPVIPPVCVPVALLGSFV